MEFILPLCDDIERNYFIFNVKVSDTHLEVECVELNLICRAPLFSNALKILGNPPNQPCFIAYEPDGPSASWKVQIPSDRFHEFRELLMKHKAKRPEPTCFIAVGAQDDDDY
ncbi:hypothetical protein ABR855_04485 [Aeromonas hydrophila]|uniref:hypothetical protein n=1 Tax=Aeromonas hydrophila TaxID=644 RepID=UPI003305AE4D